MSNLHFVNTIDPKVQLESDKRVLWIHGYTVNSTIWNELWDLLPQWSHHGIDLPGHGASDRLGEGVTLASLGEEIAEAAIERGIQHVVGLSLGSMIALQVVLARPEVFTSLTLGAPALAGGPIDHNVGIRYRELQALYQIRGAGPWMTELWMRYPPATFAHSNESLHNRLESIINRHSWQELCDSKMGIAGLALQPQQASALTQVMARLLILVGEHELPAFRQTAKILQLIRPDAQIVELQGVGHLCMLQAPEFTAQLMSEHWTHSPSWRACKTGGGS